MVGPLPLLAYGSARFAPPFHMHWEHGSAPSFDDAVAQLVTFGCNLKMTLG